MEIPSMYDFLTCEERKDHDKCYENQISLKKIWKGFLVTKTRCVYLVLYSSFCSPGDRDNWWLLTLLLLECRKALGRFPSSKYSWSLFRVKWKGHLFPSGRRISFSKFQSKLAISFFGRSKNLCKDRARWNDTIRYDTIRYFNVGFTVKLGATSRGPGNEVEVRGCLLFIISL